ncbi:hypothetical protein ABPG72_011120 [Tetrahymena utriculariae]
MAKDRTITHYEFVNKINFGIIQIIDPQSFLTKHVCSFSTPFVYFGLSNGDIIRYNRKKYSQFTIDLANKQQGQQYSDLEIGYLSETSTDLWVWFSNSLGIYKIDIVSKNFQQIIKLDDLTTFKMLNQLNAMILNVDEQNARIYLNFVGEKVLRVFDFAGNLVQYLSLPGVIMYNNLQINESHLLLYTKFHVMIYDRKTLQYIQRIRRDNHNNFIVKVIQLNEQYIILLSQDKYELFKLQQDSIEAILIHQFQLQNPQYMDCTITSNNRQSINQMMQVFLLSDNQVLEYQYDLNYENIQTLNRICSI